MATTSDIRNGMMIRLPDDIYEVIEFLHVKPGKGQAFVRTKLKGVTTEKVIDKTFPAGSEIEEVRVERHPYQFLYEDGEMLVFMHPETYDQIMVTRNLINKPEFLTENAICDLMIEANTGKVLKVILPRVIEVEVTYTEPGVRGDTVSNVMKPATISTGAQVKVPLFINVGDWIKIDTTTGEYIERVKK